jgi:type 1 glutamine amidotransferase
MRSIVSMLLVSLFAIWTTQLRADEPVSASKTRILLIGQGGDGHPATTHEYRAGTQLLAKLVSRTPHVQAVVVSADGDWADGPTLLDSADVVVLFVSEGAKWIQTQPTRLAAFQRFAHRKGGLVCLHWGMGTKSPENIPAFVSLFGGCHGGPDRRYKVLTSKLEPSTSSHPVTRGVQSVEVHEEFYYQLKFPKDRTGHQSLLTTKIEDMEYPVAWAWERPEGGRSLGFSGLHFHENWKHESYRRFLTQAALWAGGREIPTSGVDVSVTAADLQLPKTP